MVRRLRGVFERGVVGVRDDRVGGGGCRCEEGEVGVGCQPAFGGEVEEADVVEDAEIIRAGGVRAVTHAAEDDEVVVPCSMISRKNDCKLA